MLRVISLLLRILSPIAPRLAGRIAFQLFCLVPKPRPTPAYQRILKRAEPILAEATTHNIAYGCGYARVFAWPAKGERRGTTLLVHGWTSEALLMTAFVEPLRARGQDVLAVDLPAHGGSSGRFMHMVMASQALQAVMRAFGPIDAIIAHSLGGAVSLMAAEGAPPLDGPQAVKRFVLIAIPDCIAPIVEQFGSAMGLSRAGKANLRHRIMQVALRPPEALSSRAFLDNVKRPSLLIHARDDREVPFADAEQIAASGSYARLMAVDEVGHRRILVHPPVLKAAVDFAVGEEAVELRAAE